MRQLFGRRGSSFFFLLSFFFFNLNRNLQFKKKQSNGSRLVVRNEGFFDKWEQ